MATEVERKFLVEEPPADLPSRVARSLAQGYLAASADGEEEVRLRRDGDRFLLTAKRGRGLVRDEVEIEISEPHFNALWPLTEGRRIEKARYTIPVGRSVAELDVYEGALTGLCVVEVEFPDEAGAVRFDPPPWFGLEVTGERGWSNAELATKGRPDR